MEDARRRLQIYPGKYVRDKSPGAPSEVIVEVMDDVYNGNLNDGDWTLGDLQSTADATVAGREMEISESFSRSQPGAREAGVEVPQHLVELFSNLTGQHIATPSPAISPNVKCLEVNVTQVVKRLGVPDIVCQLLRAKCFRS